jgi:lipopolysaccharide transport system ATP-binding protein
MSDVAIRVENLSKRFVLGERIGIKTFRETLQDLFTAPFRRWVKNNGDVPQEKVDTDKVIWALKDVSFEVKHGEVLGIIGPNGAGKSTLLKILSRITEPTGGYAEIRGRVGSLLEVGTGFHPELTGRENIYLNGAILGMSKAEIRRKFDDIVSFAGVEKFIDTPVKRYSSGMQVRLAFAVAAHLEPEILIIDEVLAVGDAEFQKRCLGKMDEVSRSGRTVLFVSHNMAAIEGLCTRVLWLDEGRLLTQGDTLQIVSQYMARYSVGCSEWHAAADQRVDGPLVTYACIGTEEDPTSGVCPMGSNLHIVVAFDNIIDSPSRVELSIRFRDAYKRRILTCNNTFQLAHPLVLRSSGQVECVIPDCRLTPGRYEVEVLCSINGVPLHERPRLELSMLPSDLYGTGKVLPPHTATWAPPVLWRVSGCSGQ